MTAITALREEHFPLVGLFLLRLLFRPGAPVRVIDRRVLQQRREHENEAHY